MKRWYDITQSLLVPFRHTDLSENFQGEPFKLEPTYPFCIPDDPDMLKIETGIPIPSKQNKLMKPENQEIVDTMKALEPGQSFFVPTLQDAQARAHNQLAQFIKKYCPERLFAKRTVKGNNPGIRIWRVE